VIEANQSGLISEVGIDITPKSSYDLRQLLPNHLTKSQLIICDGSRLQGQIGISTDELIRFSTRFAVYSDPLYENVTEAAKNASVAAAGVSQLTDLWLDEANQCIEQSDGNSLGATTEQIRLTTGQVNRLSPTSTVCDHEPNLLTTALNNITKTSEQLRVTVNDHTHAQPDQSGRTGPKLRNSCSPGVG